MGERPTKPGWYDDPAGDHKHEAYWDGERWTGETRSPSGRGCLTVGFWAAMWFPTYIAIAFVVGTVLGWFVSGSLGGQSGFVLVGLPSMLLAAGVVIAAARRFQQIPVKVMIAVIVVVAVGFVAVTTSGLWAT